jgi:hypothetical protein
MPAQDPALPDRPARWWILDEGVPTGPVELVQVRERVLDGTVTPETYVWADGMPDWLRAREVPALTPPLEVRANLPSWR